MAAALTAASTARRAHAVHAVAVAAQTPAFAIVGRGGQAKSRYASSLCPGLLFLLSLALASWSSSKLA
jgi:hypothetical protein